MVLLWYNHTPAWFFRLKGNTMVKKLSKHGNSLALVIDRSILDLLKIDEDTSLEVTTDGESLIVAPVRGKKRQKKFEHALASSNERYGKALKRLAE
jgi:antitoxin component of MazEF toxin-antitoxin module